MSFLELEELMEGMEKNSKREKELYEGKRSASSGNANDLLSYINQNGNAF